MSRTTRNLVILPLALTIGLLAKGAAYAEPTSSLTVMVEDIETQSGVIRMGLFATEADYNTDAAQSGREIAVDATSVTFVFDALEPGQYAIKLYQDVDNNGQLDTGMFGIPKEPFAFSNNASGRMGPAKWADAAFIVGPDATTHTLSLQ